MTSASVIVCTRDRRDAVLRCLEAVEQSALAARPATLETLVVDDGSSDDTSDAVRRFAANASSPVRLLSQDSLGLSAARNAGVRAAAGRLLIFIDDDCMVSRGYLPDVFDLFGRDAELVLRGGRVELGDPRDAPLTIKAASATERLQRGRDPAGFILGCNMAMRRDVLERVGPFDERFGAGGKLRAAEDSDFILRTLLAGIAVEYVHDHMVVRHHHGRRRRTQILAAQRNYDIGNGALMLKHLAAAPWLLRIWWWTLRNALKELAGGPGFDDQLGLSHGPIAWHAVEGALRFTLAKLQGARAYRGRWIESAFDESGPANVASAYVEQVR